jgi:hypothetical protein
MDPIHLGALALALLIVLAAFLWPAKGAGPVAAAARRAHPGRALIDHFEEVGRDSAGRLIAERLGLVEADAIADKFGRAFNKPAASAPAPPPSPPNP